MISSFVDFLRLHIGNFQGTLILLLLLTLKKLKWFESRNLMYLKRKCWVKYLQNESLPCEIVIYPNFLCIFWHFLAFGFFCCFACIHEFSSLSIRFRVSSTVSKRRRKNILEFFRYILKNPQRKFVANKITLLLVYFVSHTVSKVIFWRYWSKVEFFRSSKTY